MIPLIDTDDLLECWAPVHSHEAPTNAGTLIVALHMLPRDVVTDVVAEVIFSLEGWSA